MLHIVFFALLEAMRPEEEGAIDSSAPSVQIDLIYACCGGFDWN